jgi:hypothetical protein
MGKRQPSGTERSCGEARPAMGTYGVMVDITHLAMDASMMAVDSAMLANPKKRSSFPFSLGILEQARVVRKIRQSAKRMNWLVIMLPSERKRPVTEFHFILT